MATYEDGYICWRFLQNIGTLSESKIRNLPPLARRRHFHMQAPLPGGICRETRTCVLLKLVSMQISRITNET